MTGQKQLVVVNAGLSNPSTTRDIATRVAYAAERAAVSGGADGQAEQVEVRVLDLRALAADLATYMTTMIPTPALEDARLLVSGADGLVAATPVFQGSYSGLFKMFFDTLDKHALEDMPVTLVATAGTPRHSMVLDYAMRPLLSFLQATVLPTGVFAATGEFGEDGDLQARVERAGREMARQLVDVPAAGRDAAAVPDASGGYATSGFEALLKVHGGAD